MCELVPTCTCGTPAALVTCQPMRRSISVMPGWVSEPEGCGLMETPGCSKVQGAPSLPAMDFTSQPPPAALQQTRRASRNLSVAVQPYPANGRATTPLSTERPTGNGLVTVPTFPRHPAHSPP